MKLFKLLSLALFLNFSFQGFGAKTQVPLESLIRELFEAVEEYKSLYPRLTKSFCNTQLNWTDESVRNQDAKKLQTLISSAYQERNLDADRISGQENTFTKMAQKAKESMERMATKDGSSHKLQTITEALRYQAQIAPGGFKATSELETHIRDINNIVKAFTTAAIGTNQDHVVFSNEALKQERYPQGYQTTVLAGVEKENNAATVLTQQDSRRIEENGKILLRLGNFFTSHFSSIVGKKRDAASADFVQDRLREFIQSLQDKVGEGSQLSFAGDINLYLFKDTVRDGKITKRELRENVQDVLDKFKLVLIVPSGRFNEDIREAINEQWHKFKGSLEHSHMNTKADSLVVLEPYLKEFDYSSLYDNGIGGNQDIFFPTDTKMQHHINLEEAVKQPFGQGCVMDHQAVRGRLVSIMSGADGDGTGNKTKAFLSKSEVNTDNEAKYQQIICMTINVKMVNKFLKNLLAEKTQTGILFAAESKKLPYFISTVLPVAVVGFAVFYQIFR